MRRLPLSGRLGNVEAASMNTSPSAASAATTRALAPQTPGATSASATGAVSLTQKTWVIPPRPKPGRKPATDTPASKRKAQNRVAQRAFRERKAAKVGELEVQVDQVARAHQSEVEQLRSDLVSLSAKLDQRLASGVSTYDHDVTTVRMELDSWKAKYHHERKTRETLEEELAILKGEAVSLPRKRQGTRTELAVTDLLSPQQTVVEAYGTPEELPLGCARCSLTHCQCLEEALSVAPTTEDSPAKRPLSPVAAAVSRRDDKKPRLVEDADSTDNPNNTQHDNLPVMDSAADQCGFCQEGTACLCAELAAERERAQDQPSSLPSPPGEDVPAQPAYPAEIDFTTFTPPAATASTKAPGTCEQCRNDPTSKGFCKGLAAVRASDRPSASVGETVSCARAFSTLKQHPAFGRASKNIQEWLPHLSTIATNRAGSSSGPARSSYTAFEIESASVLDVLKHFDRKFGMEP